MGFQEHDTWADERVTDDDAETPPLDETPDGRFTLGRLLGRGGMAEVRAAADHTLGREVAIKLLRLVTPGMRERFLTEARTTARLEHPNIVPVHDLGLSPDGSPYLVMKQVRGRSLAKLQGEAPMPLEAVLPLFRKVCDAVAFAHARGVLHRDLKPDNIMVGEFGEVLLMDWGIAWSMDPGLEDPKGGPRGELAGTPAYMSPEQAAGAPEGLDFRSDVYGLGAVLYTLLTGQPPFVGMADEVLALVREGAFAAPRRLRPELPAELERVLLRAMALRPEDRYPSVVALIEDIDAFLARRPLVHVRSTWQERLGKWLDRHRGAVRSALAVAGVALVGLLAGVWRYTSDVGAARDAALSAADRASHAEAEAVAGLVAAQVALADTLSEQGLLLEAHRHLERAEALVAGRQMDRRALDLALSAHVSDNPPPISQCSPHGGAAARALELGPEGRWAVSWGDDGRLLRWDPLDCAVRQTLTLGSSAGPGALDARAGAGLVVADDQLVQVVVDPGSGELREARRVSPPFEVTAVGVDGAQAWARDRQGQLWGLLDGALSPLAAGARVGELWRPAAGGRLWLADSRRTGREIGGAWRTDTGAALYSGSGVNGVAASPDGKTVLIGSATGARAVDGRGVERWASPLDPVDSVGVAPGGAVGWVVGFDGSVFLVDLETGRGLVAFVGPGATPTAVATTDTAQVVSIGRRDGSVQTYLRSETEPAPASGDDELMLQGLALSPDGLLLATGDDAGMITLFDVPTGRSIRTWGPHGSSARQMAFSPDGARLAVALRVEGVSVFDLGTGEEICFPLQDRTVSIAWVGGAPYTVDVNGSLLRLDLEARRAVALGQGLRAPSWGLAALGEDRLVTAGHLGGEPGLAVIQVSDGQILQRLPLDDAGYHVTVSPDQGRVAVGTHGGDVRIIDLKAGAEVLRMHADAGPTMGVAFSPDGSLLASTGYSRQVRVWDARTGLLLRSAAQHDGPGLTLSFAPDGSAIYSGGTEGYRVLPLVAHRQHAAAVMALRGPGVRRAAALAALGWWGRVEEALGAEGGDGRALAQARFVLRQPAPPPRDLYQALLARAPRD